MFPFRIQVAYLAESKILTALIITFLQIKAVLQAILMWNCLVKILCRWNNIIKNINVLTWDLLWCDYLYCVLKIIVGPMVFQVFIHYIQ